MRKLLTLAIVTAIGAWVLKCFAEVGNDNLCNEGIPQFSDEEEESQAVDEVGDEVTPSPSDGEIRLESEPVEEVLLLPDGEINPQAESLDDGFDEATAWFPEEETDSQSQPVEDVPDETEIPSPLDLSQMRRPGDAWSLPIGPNGEEKLREARTEVDDRLHKLPRRHRRAA